MTWQLSTAPNTLVCPRPARANTHQCPGRSIAIVFRMVTRALSPSAGPWGSGSAHLMVQHCGVTTCLLLPVKCTSFGLIRILCAVFSCLYHICMSYMYVFYNMHYFLQT